VENLNQAIVGVRTLELSAKGDISWVSAARLKAMPDGVPFNGTLLVGPPELANITKHKDFHILLSSDPRLMFAQIVNGLMPQLSDLGLPGPGEPAISPKATIHPTAILSPGVVVGPHVSIGANSYVAPNTVVCNAVVGERVWIGPNCSIGLNGFGFQRSEDGSYIPFPHLGKVILESDIRIGSNTIVARGSLGNTIIGRGVKIDDHVHVSHNVVIGENSLIIAHAIVGGSTKIGKNVWVGPNASVIDNTTIGDDAFIGLGAVVIRSVERGTTVVGNPAREIQRES